MAAPVRNILDTTLYVGRELFSTRANVSFSRRSVLMKCDDLTAVLLMIQAFGIWHCVFGQVVYMSKIICVIFIVRDSKIPALWTCSLRRWRQYDHVKFTSQETWIYRVILLSDFIYVLCYYGVCSGTVGWGTALQVRRSWVRFPMVTLEFFIDIILSAALWPWSWLSL
jgi:hypothetical protein